MRPWTYKIEGEGDEALRHALNYVAACDWSGRAKFTVTHYDVVSIKEDKWGCWIRDETENGTQILLLGSKSFNSEGSITALAFPHDTEAVFDFVRRWVKHANAGIQPDTDGDNNRGWRVRNPHCVAGSACYAAVAIQAAWITYGK